MDEVALSQEESVYGIRQIARNLGHPQSIGLLRDSASRVDPAL